MFLLAGMFVVTAADPSHAKCAFDGAAAVSEISDAATYLWAASQRCGRTAVSGAKNPMCTIDIASATQAVSDMVVVIAKAVEDCGAIHGENLECGMAIGGLTGAAAGLTAGASGIAQDCTGANPLPAASAVFSDRVYSGGKCIVDAKDTITNLVAASMKLGKVSKACEAGSVSCTNNVLSIIGAAASMGSALAGTVTDCQSVAPTSAGNKNAKCVQSSLRTVAALDKLGLAGTNIAHKCTVSAARLYELEAAQTGSSSNSLVFGMAAFIPIAAVLSFVVGARFAKLRESRNPHTSCDSEAAEELVPMS